MDERDLPAIERAARDAEILKWFDPHTRSPADYLAAKREAWKEMRLGRLQLHTDPDNVASQRVAERAGFTREGVLRAYNGRRDGTRADAFVYSGTPRTARFSISS